MKILKFLKEYGWCIWLGMAPGLIFDANINDWRWYAFSIPFILLIAISRWMEIKK